LAIGKNPTALHNQYLVLSWDFSAVSPVGEPQQIQNALTNYVNESIFSFSRYYQHILPLDIKINPEDAQASFQSLFTAIRQTPYLLYLFIDEYDNFANEVMLSDKDISQSRYQALLSGEGALKALFKVVKSAAGGRGLDRVFITGVSPVLLSDITSGYVVEDIFLQKEFNDLCGFKESEIARTLNQIAQQHQFSTRKIKEALNLMQTFYDGYCFNNHSQIFVYNPTLALYFLKTFQRECQPPRKLLDSNLSMDRGKIAYISRLPYGEELIMSGLNEGETLSIDELADRFGIDDLLFTAKDETFMASLLYYFGILTLDGFTATGELSLKIPNLVVQKLYIERIQEILLPDVKEKKFGQLAAKTFCQTGNIQPLCENLEHRYFKAFDNRDYRWANELTVKTAFLTLLFNDQLYIMDSETELERSYADLTMIIRPDMRQYNILDILIEFKYVSLQDANLSGEHLKKLSREQLVAQKPVQQKLAEAKIKLEGYRQVLGKKYGEKLRLHTFCVVAVGFDRLVWLEV